MGRQRTGSPFRPDPHIGQGHQRIGGHVQPDVLHHAQGAQPGIGGTGGHFQGDFFVGAVFEIEIALLGDLKQVEEISEEGVPG
jgi:hypothetical protein